MKRRVIFVDPELWTTPKENRMTINPANAGDYRRAGAFIKWHAHGNRDGINAILLEALEAKRPTQFIAAILNTFDGIVPMLATKAGQRGMAELIIAIADGTDNLDPDVVPEDWRRAARLMVAYGENNSDTMNRILHETPDVSPTIIGICDVYTVVLPMLHTPFGMGIIDTGIRRLSGMEAEGRQ
ncbi:hypothetical protein NWT09_00100 [Mycolicibacterium sp. jd]|uniref:hypothetical protein n=1 Tax=unclassified Mycolicibacterium TaxID=2636767 RepID=UPI00351BAC53